MLFFFFQAEDGIRDGRVTGVQTCALPIYRRIVHDECGDEHGRESPRVSTSHRISRNMFERSVYRVLSSWGWNGSIVIGEPMIVVTHYLAALAQHIVLDRPQAFGMGLDDLAREVPGVPSDQKQVSALVSAIRRLRSRQPTGISSMCLSYPRPGSPNTR